jgi:DNA-binding CsgD family transcriptional regulator
VLTEHEVKQIVGLDNRGHTSGEIARELRRKPTTVYNVIKGLSWSWLTGRQRKVLEMME